MTSRISDKQIERYLAGALSGSATRRIDAALKRSAALRRRLDELRGELETLRAVRDSQSIRPPEEQERRIAANVMGNITTTMQRT